MSWPRCPFSLSFLTSPSRCPSRRKREKAKNADVAQLLEEKVRFSSWLVGGLDLELLATHGGPVKLEVAGRVGPGRAHGPRVILGTREMRSYFRNEAAAGQF